MKEFFFIRINNEGVGENWEENVDDWKGYGKVSIENLKSTNEMNPGLGMDQLVISFIFRKQGQIHSSNSFTFLNKKKLLLYIYFIVFYFWKLVHGIFQNLITIKYLFLKIEISHNLEMILVCCTESFWIQLKVEVIFFP